MDLDFPASPTLNQYHDDGDNRWQWDGIAWIRCSLINQRLNGQTDVTGNLVLWDDTFGSSRGFNFEVIGGGILNVWSNQSTQYVHSLNKDGDAWFAGDGQFETGILTLGDTGGSYTRFNNLGQYSIDGGAYTALSGMTGPVSSVDNNFPSFNGTTGKILKDSGYSVNTFLRKDISETGLTLNGYFWNKADASYPAIGNVNTAGKFTFGMADASMYGAYMTFYGAAYGSGISGDFIINANTGTGGKILRGKPDGTLQWDGVDISLVTHNHTGVYSPVSHSHSGVYSAIGHSHYGEILNAAIYREAVDYPAISAGAVTINWQIANVFEISLNANITSWTMSNLPTYGISQVIKIQFTADGTARTITWPAAVKWPNGNAPTITSTNGKKDTILLATTTGGTDYIGHIASLNA